MNDKSGFEVAKQFCAMGRWDAALWLATTYRCHPTGGAPPVMGLVFANWAAGVELFRVWTRVRGNADTEDDIRVAVIEGDIPDQRAGYSIRISAAQADWEQSRGGAESLSQVQRMHPLPERPDMLQDFKRDYQVHGEFLLAPVVERDDGQLYFNVDAGIIKRRLELRNSSDVSTNEPDTAVLQPPPTLDVFLGLDE